MGRVSEVEVDPDSGDVCFSRRRTGLHTVHMAEQPPATAAADGRGGCWQMMDSTLWVSVCVCDDTGQFNKSSADLRITAAVM